MEYQISEDKRQYYEYHVDKVIKNSVVNKETILVNIVYSKCKNPY